MKPLILDMETISKTIEEIESGSNIIRKRRSWNSERVRTGDLRPFVELRIKEMYPKTYPMYSISDYSILNKVINKKSKAYKESPIRKIQDMEKSSEMYNEITKRYNLNQAMNQLDIVYNENKYGMIACMMDREVGPSAKAKNFWKFYALAPYEFDVIKDDDGQVQCVIISYPSKSVMNGGDGVDSKIAEVGRADENTEERQYAFWTDEQHIMVHVKGKDRKKTISIVPIEGNESGKNPYGIIPFVYVPMDFDANYPNPSPLPTQTVEFNALMSVYLTSANMQVGVLKITRPEKQKISVSSQSLYTAIEVPQSSRPEDKPTDINFISPQPNMSGHREAITTYLSTIMDEQGISSSSVLKPTEEFTSGFDRLLAQADVQQIIEENQELYARVEEKLYKIVATQLKNVSGDGSLPLNDPAKNFQIIYKKPRVMLSDREKLENLKLMKDLGIWSDWELVQMYDPNLSPDEARQKLMDIQTAKVEMASQFTDPSKVFNGAQVSAIVEVAGKVGIGELTAEAGANILITSFGIPEEQARGMMPPEKSVESPEPKANPFMNTQPKKDEEEEEDATK